MRDQYWSFLQNIYYLDLYYQRYYNTWSFIDRGVDILCNLVSCGSVAAWGIWKKWPMLWALLICGSQIIGVVRPHMQAQRRVNALSMLLPQLKLFELKVNNLWRLHQADNYDYTEKLIEFKSEWVNLETMFLGADEIPDRKYIRYKIGPEWETELKKEFFPDGGDNCARKVEASQPEPKTGENSGAEQDN